MAVAIGIAQAGADTGGGDQTITSPTSIGTPTGAIFIACGGTVNGTPSANAIMSVGATDGIRHRVISAASRDAVDSSETRDWGTTDEVIQMVAVDGDNIESEANFKNWETDGVTITWGNTPAAAYKIFVIFFSGVDQIYVNDFTSSSDLDGEVDVTDPGFEPDQLFVFGKSGALDDAVSAAVRLSFGVCDNDGASPYPQACMNLSEPDNSGTSNPHCITRDDRVINNLFASNIFGDVEIDSFDASGFSSFTRRVAGNVDVCYLAVKYSSDGSVGHWAAPIDSPAATGNWAVAAPGFVPQFMLLGMNMVNADDAVESDNDAGAFVLGAATADEEYCAGYYTEDGQGTMDTDSLADNQIVNVMTPGGGSTQFAATWSSFDANGWTLSVATRAIPNREWFGLAIEADAAPAANYRGSMLGADVAGSGAIIGG